MAQCRRPVILAITILTLAGCTSVPSDPSPVTSAATSSPAPHPSDARVTTIDAARRAAPGSRVTVEGAVSTPPGAFRSSLADSGFGLQDASAGIFVSMPKTVAVRLNDRVRVTGALIVSKVSGALTLRPGAAGDVEQLGIGAAVVPRTIRTGAVTTATEGTLLRTTGVMSSNPADDLPYGRKFELDDGSGAVRVYVNLSTGISVRDLNKGDRVTVTGFSSVYGGSPELDVRQSSDLER